MAQSHDDPIVARSEIVTLHWEGPPAAVPPPEHRFPDSPEEERAALEAERERSRADQRRHGSEPLGVQEVRETHSSRLRQTRASAISTSSSPPASDSSGSGRCVCRIRGGRRRGTRSSASMAA